MRSLRACATALGLVLLAGSALAGAETNGAAIYRSRCGSCHGANGAGTKRNAKMTVPDLRSKEIQSLTNQQMYETIAYGTQHREYPHAFLYTGLNRQQIESVVTFIRALK